MSIFLHDVYVEKPQTFIRREKEGCILYNYTHLNI